MQLRPYQQEAIKALFNLWSEAPMKAPLIVCPTGGGKSLIIANIISQISKHKPKYRFIIATHTKEIVRQNANELGNLIDEPLGIYSAGLGSKIVRRVTFANIQSIYKKDFICDMLIIDECHLLSRNSNSMYQKFISKLRRDNNNLKIVGFTATPMRMDQGSLISQDSIFNDIAYDISIRTLIEQNYLCNIISRTKDTVDTSNVRKSGHDFNQIQLEEVFNQTPLIQRHCEEMIKQGHDRKAWLIFCTGIDHAKEVNQKLISLGIEADYVTSEMLSYERDNKINKFKEGKLRALCNVGILTTGFNYPAVDMVVLQRATESASLYIQMVGRGTRVSFNKSNLLVLDFGGNIERHGPIDLITVEAKSGVKSTVKVEPFRTCPQCGAGLPIRISLCPYCQHKFEVAIILQPRPSIAPVLSVAEEYEVSSWDVRIHKKVDKPDSFKIVYNCGLKSFYDFLCFEHGGYARLMAMKKWQERGGQSPAPQTVHEAMQRQLELLSISKIKVVKSGKFDQIVSFTFKKVEDSVYEL